MTTPHDPWLRIFGLVFFGIWMGMGLSGCADRTAKTDQRFEAPPKRPESLCHIVREKPYWGEALVRVEQRYQVPAPLIMAIMYQESSFRADARPPFRPGNSTQRLSSAYGYGQFLDGTFEDYQQQTGAHRARRDDFSDAVLAMGWYLYRSNDVLTLDSTDAYLHYLAYHDGPYALQRQNYRPKAFLHQAARKVSTRYHKYRRQWEQCVAKA